MYTLEQACGGSSTFPTQEKTESMIINLIMPLCLRVGSGRPGGYNANNPEQTLTNCRFADCQNIRQMDISFALTLVLHAMSPPNTKTTTSGTQNIKAATEIRTGSLTFTGTRDTKTAARINISLYQVSFLGN